MECIAPKCEFSKRWEKCIIPNAYNEKMAWCKRNNISNAKCRTDYNSEEAKKIACVLYEERKKLKSMNLKNTKDPIKDPTKYPIKDPTKDVTSIDIQGLTLNPKRRIIKAKRSIPSTFLNKLQKDAGLKIFKFMKANIIERYETLGNRIKYYYYVQNFLKHIPNDSCLDHYIIPEKDIEGYRIKNINLIKKIGSESVNAIIYKTTIDNNIITIASKIMSLNEKNKQELKLNIKATKLIVYQLSRHFLINYKIFICNKKFNGIKVPLYLKYKPYYISLNEMVYNDLKYLCDTDDFLNNKEDIYNVILQVLLSIFTFHQLGYTHNDCHWGNFLFHKNKTNKNGYYHYIIKDTSYYLKQCNYTIIIHDFSLATQNDKVTSLRMALEDYRRILHSFILNIQGGWLPSSKTYLISDVSNIISKLHIQLSSIYDRVLINEDKFFIETFISFFLKCRNLKLDIP